MTLPKLTFFFTCLFLLTSWKAQIKLTQNFDDAVLYFQQQWTPAELDNFKNKPEGDVVIEYTKTLEYGYETIGFTVTETLH